MGNIIHRGGTLFPSSSSSEKCPGGQYSLVHNVRGTVFTGGQYSLGHRFILLMGVLCRRQRFDSVFVILRMYLSLQRAHA